MAARTCRMELRMTKDEYDVLKEKAGRAGLSLSAFVRKAVAGKVIAESPPADVPMLIREVRRVGFNINQILRAINGKGGHGESDGYLRPSGHGTLHSLPLLHGRLSDAD